MRIIKNMFFIAIMLVSVILTSQYCYAENAKSDAITQKYGFTLQEEEEIGFQATLAYIKKYGYYKNPLINQYISGLGESIVKKVSKRPNIKYRFLVLDTIEVNAFAAPGGFIMITKGALIVLDNEAELVGILGHEITHVEEGHGLQAIASDPTLKEKLKQLKVVLAGGTSLGKTSMSRFDEELKKNQKDSTIVNFQDLKNAEDLKSIDEKLIIK